MKKDKSRKLTSDEQNFILALYKIEYENLCKYADKMMKGSLAAEDLVQDTLIIACRKIDELIKHPKPGAFLMDTLRKNIYNYCNVNLTFGGTMKNRIKELREQRGLTQEQLGELVGASRQAINAIETEKFEPSIWLAYDISQIFDCPIEEVFLFEEEEL